MSYFVGVDIGGTFTDCVAVSDAGDVHFAKTPSTHATTPVDGVLAGLDLLAEGIGTTTADLLAATERFSHGTTIGTNLVVERKGARVGLIATAGHGDALLMMRGNGRTAGLPVDQVFSVHATDKPAPLVAPGRIAEIDERVTVDGAVLAPLDDDRARAVVRSLVEGEDVDAIAIALLWSIRNGAHEQRIRDLVREVAPDVFVSVSSETAPRQGEYERTVATVINSYVGPASSRYLAGLAEALRSRGLCRPPFIMQGNGGVVPVAVAGRVPVTTIGSGPAGGLAGTAAIAAAAGHRNVIATDMGGTSFEVGLIVDGRPTVSRQQVLDRYTFHVPQLDIRSIACGGGSIARMDPHSGALRVGPESAGATPGPACYGTGTEPTVTDADVVLGFIDPDGFLDGRMALDRQAAYDAIAELANGLGLGVEETAAGIVRINSHSAATLIRQRTVEQGLDPRDFVLYAFGGAGPVHAFAFAEELGVAEVVIPLGNGASLLSAYGISASDVLRSFERECHIRAPFDPGELAAVLEPLEAEALQEMRDAGFAADDVILERVPILRYAEQFLQELPLTLPTGPLGEDACAELAGRFDAEYVRLYGEGARAVFQNVEIFTMRVDARVPLPFAGTIADAAATDGHRAVVSDETRPVFWPQEGQWVPTALHDGRTLAAGHRVVGPALVELPHTTVAVAAGQSLRRDHVDNLVLETA